MHYLPLTLLLLYASLSVSRQPLSQPQLNSFSSKSPLPHPHPSPTPLVARLIPTVHSPSQTFSARTFIPPILRFLHLMPTTL